MTIRTCRCGKREQLRRGLCHACYERNRRAGRIESMVPALPVRDHIVNLHSAGWRDREIARAAGIDRSLIGWIMHGREQIQAKTAKSIRAVPPTGRARFILFAWDTRRGVLQRNSLEAMRAEWDQRTEPPPEPLPEPGDWVNDALCAQVDNDIFFPDKGGRTDDAKKVCLRCAVRQECLEYALENDIGFGIFGGLSVKERKRRMMEE